MNDQIKLQEEVQKGKEAVEEYQQLLINEKKKLIAGYSTIFFLLSFESTLTSSMVTYVQLEGALAKNIARIRFLTGTLVEYSPCTDAHAFFVADAFSLPFNQDVEDRHDLYEGRKNDK